MRTKRSLINVMVELSTFMFIGILGFIKIRESVNSLGSELNGYYQFIIQLLAYLFIIEAGMSVAIVYKMYEPFSDLNRGKISQLYCGSIVIMRRIGYLMLIFGALLLPFVFVAVGFNDYTRTVVLTYVFIMVGNALPYLLFSKAYSTLFFADQKKYIHSLAFQAVKIVSEIIAILIIINFQSLLLIGVSYLIFKIIEEIIIDAVALKTYGWVNRKAPPDTTPQKNTTDLIWNQVGYLITNNIDTILLLPFGGPVMVSIYATYNYLKRFLVSSMTKVSDGVIHSFGVTIVKDEKTKTYSVFYEYLALFFVAGMILSLTFFLIAAPIVAQWIGQSIYVLPRLAIFFFSFTLFLNIILQPLIATNLADGEFKESKKVTIVSTLVNVIFSLMLVKPFGIIGLLAATTLSMFIDIMLRANIVSKKTLADSTPRLHVLFAKYICVYLLFAIILTVLSSKFYPDGFSTSNIASMLIVIGAIIVLTLAASLLDPSVRRLLKRIMLIIPKKKSGKS